MDKISDMTDQRHSPDPQRLEDLRDFVTCFQLINRIEQRLMLIHDLGPSGADVPAYWMLAHAEIEQLASIEAAARKAYHSTVRAGYDKDPMTMDVFPILRDALSAIASSLGHAFAVCAAAAEQLENTSVALRDQPPQQQEGKSS